MLGLLLTAKLEGELVVVDRALPGFAAIAKSDNAPSRRADEGGERSVRNDREDRGESRRVVAADGLDLAEHHRRGNARHEDYDHQRRDEPAARWGCHEPPDTTESVHMEATRRVEL